MLITQLKSKEAIESLSAGKVFIINCHGCKEVSFPEAEAKELQKVKEGESIPSELDRIMFYCNNAFFF